MKTVFVGKHGRLRTLWRLLVFVIIFLAIAAPSKLAIRAMLGGLPNGSALELAVTAAAATAATFIARKFIDRKTIASLGVAFDEYAVRDLIFGVALSSLIIATFFVIVLVKGYIRVDSFEWTQLTDVSVNQVLSPLAVVMIMLFIKFVFVGWWEELVFRGYLVQNLIDGLGKVWAVIISCAIFGLVHSSNPGASWLSDSIIALITLLLVMAYLLSGRLWLPVGIHLGWNFTQGPIFGFGVSGMETPSLVEQTPIAPNWISGGSFGPENSILIIPLVLTSLPIIYFYTRGREAPQAA